MSRECVMLFALFAIATEPCMRYLSALFARMEKTLGEIEKKWGRSFEDL
jgi:cation-transporting ATPase E